MEPQETRYQDADLERMVLTQVMRMDATINGIVAGLLVGSIILVATLWLVIKGGPVVGPHLGLLGQFFFGYSVTYLGSVVGFVYGFIVGFAVGYFMSRTYNLLVDLREARRVNESKKNQARILSGRSEQVSAEQQ
jgi:hypothetical protein